MTSALVVFCTCGTPEEALRIAHSLVEERFAACVNILPQMRSVYRWQGLVEDAQETLLVIKTSSDRLPELRERVSQLHSYEVPEILAVEVADGAPAYLAWLLDQVGP